jgi:hypothetical protein
LADPRVVGAEAFGRVPTARDRIREESRASVQYFSLARLVATRAGFAVPLVPNETNTMSDPLRVKLNDAALPP